MALIDVIKFDGLKSRDWLIYKYPSDKLVLGTQLIVQEGQIAAFAKGGTICDVFYPGTHTLSTSNIPILQSIVNLPFGGNTPFTAEIYYINTVTKLDLTWGTTDPIQLIDPKYYVKLRVRAFGQMGLKLADPVTFLKELIGGMNPNDIVRFDKINDFYRGILVIKVKSSIADAIISNQISALEISTKLETLSEKVSEQISSEFQKFGLKVVNFYIQSINFPDEDFAKINKILEDKASFEIMGDNRYATKRSFDVYETAAGNENGVAGAFAAGGIGLGAAANIGASMGGVVGNPMNQASQPATKFCPSCNTVASASAKFCSTCGFNYNSLICSCGNKLEANSKFCPECGRKVE